MNYKDKQRIRVSKETKTLDGMILSKSDFEGSDGPLYWVQVGTDVSLFSELMLDGLNAHGPCTCGGKATNQPGCDRWCDSLEFL